MNLAVGSILVNFSEHCSIGCAHCGYAGSPRGFQASDQDLADWNRQIAQAGVPLVIYTGGEPFQRMSLLTHGVSNAVSQGLRVGVFTSAFWARKPSTAEARLAQLPGLTELYVSSDRFHQAVVHPDCVRNAIEAALNVSSLRVILCVTYSDPSEVETALSRIPDAVAHPRFKVHSAPVIPTPHISSSTFPRGDKLKSLADFEGKSSCFLHTPLISPQGNVFACHIGKVEAHGDAKASPYYLGSLREASLSEILSCASKSSHYRFLRAHGPDGVARFAQRILGIEPNERRPEYCNECSMCFETIGSPERGKLFVAYADSDDASEDTELALTFGLGGSYGGQHDAKRRSP